MSERYEKLFQLEHRFYASRAPLLIESGKLLLERKTGSVLCQLCFRNIQDRTIKSIRAEVQMLDEEGEPLGKSIRHRYQDLELEREEECGRSVAIVLPSELARAFTVRVSQVSFSDGEVWTDDKLSWEPLPDQLSLEEAFDSRREQEQFLRRFGRDSLYAPLETEELWFCACGAVNSNAAPRCHRCHLRRAALLGRNGGPASVEEQEEEDFLRTLPQEEGTGKRKRGLLLGLCGLVVLALAAVLLVPRLLNRFGASPAEAAPKSSPVPTAEATVTPAPTEEPTLIDLPEESEEPASPAPAETEEPIEGDASSESDPEHSEPEEDADALAAAYDEAGELENQAATAPREDAAALYLSAAEAYEALAEYKDSPARAKSCRDAADQLEQQDAYQTATSLLDGGHYAEARQAFLALGSYEDSADLAKEAVYRKGEALFHFLENHSLRGVTASLSSEPEKESLIYIPRDQLLALGLDGTAELIACFGQDPVRLLSDEDEDLPRQSLAEAAAQLLRPLGGYRNSPAMAAKLPDMVDRSGEFFTLCAAGDLEGARAWLNAWDKPFEDRELWLGRLDRFQKYAGAWTFKTGTKNLVSYIDGEPHDSANWDVTCVVLFTEEEAILRFLLHPGDTTGPELHCELNETYFYKDSYLVQINETGNLTVGYDLGGRYQKTAEYVRPAN